LLKPFCPVLTGQDRWWPSSPGLPYTQEVTESNPVSPTSIVLFVCQNLQSDDRFIDLCPQLFLLIVASFLDGASRMMKAASIDRPTEYYTNMFD